MPCDRWEARLLDFAEHDLPPAEAARVREHVEACESCRDELEQLQTVRRAVAAAPLPGPGPQEPHWGAFEARVLAQVRERRAARPSRIMQWLVPAGALAAVAVLVAFVGRQPFEAPATTTYAVATTQTLEAGEVAEIAASLDLAWDPPLEWDLSVELADLTDEGVRSVPTLLAQGSGTQSWATLGENGGEALGTADWWDELETLDAETFDALLNQLEQPVTS